MRLPLRLFTWLVALSFATCSYAPPEQPSTISLSSMSVYRPRDHQLASRSMATMRVRVFRAMGLQNPMETTFENLELDVPQAYTLLRPARPQSPGEFFSLRDLRLYVHLPTGRPSVFFEDFAKGHLAWERQSINYVDLPPFPENHYMLTIHGGRAMDSGYDSHPLGRRSDFASAITNSPYSDAQTTALYRGERCGWHAFDNPERRPSHPRPRGLSSVYVDSLDSENWRRSIMCGPHTFSYCRLSTEYRRFALQIDFSPTNICRADAIERHAEMILERHLIAHHPPTRRWRRPNELANWINWTNTQQNNRQIGMLSLRPWDGREALTDNQLRRSRNYRQVQIVPATETESKP